MKTITAACKTCFKAEYAKGVFDHMVEPMSYAAIERLVANEAAARQPHNDDAGNPCTEALIGA